MVFQIPPHGIRNPVGPRFRGEWNQWGEILRYIDFSNLNDLNLEELMIATYLANPPDPLVTLRPIGDSSSSNRPTSAGDRYAYTAHTASTTNELSQIFLEVDLGAAGLPVGTHVTKVTFYAEIRGNSNTIARRSLNGSYFGEASYGSTSTRWVPELLEVTLPGLSTSDRVGIGVRRSSGSGGPSYHLGIAGITIWGIPEEDRYLLGDTVSYQGELWRNIVDGNNDEPGTSARWQKVSHDILPPDLRSLNDVDLVGLYDKAVLTYHHEDQKWHPGDQTPDQRNFRGDWQDPANTLLWATDFSNPADRDFFVGSTTGEIQSLTVDVVLTESSFSTENNPSELYQNQLRYRHAVAGSGQGSTGLTFDLGQVLPDRYVSKVSLWSAASRFSTNSNYRVDYDFGGGAWTSGVGAAALRDWEETVYEVSRLNPVLKWRTVDSQISSGSAGNLLEWNLTGFKVYGAASNDDLYGLNDVTYHEGSYWRSLFPLNADEPSEESPKWEKIGDIFAQKTYALSGLTDVDLTGKFEGAILKYDEDQQVWRPGQYAPDYRNFRGDWQDPADYLLWSSDFSDPEEMESLWTHVVTGTVTSPEPVVVSPSTSSLGGDIPNTEFMVRHRIISPTEGTTGASILTLDFPQAVGRSEIFVSKVEFYHAARLRSYNDPSLMPSALQVNGESFYTMARATNSAFSEYSVPVNGIVETLAFSITDNQTNDYGGNDQWQEIALLRIYGALDNEDLYRLNDVVAHNNSYWRSLFNFNSDEPTELSEKWEKIEAQIGFEHRHFPAPELINTVSTVNTGTQVIFDSLDLNAQEGDYLLFYASTRNTQLIPVDSWENHYSIDTADNEFAYCLGRRVTDAEPSSYVWNFSSGSSRYAIATILVLRNVTDVTWVDAYKDSLRIPPVMVDRASKFIISWHTMTQTQFVPPHPGEFTPIGTYASTNNQTLSLMYNDYDRREWAVFYKTGEGNFSPYRSTGAVVVQGIIE